jgi:hypothetical protein
MEDLPMPNSSDKERAVRLQVRCVNPPAGVFGLQDKDRRLSAGQSQPDGALVFACEVRAKRAADSSPNFLGDYAHGTPTDRFLYLTLLGDDTDETQIVKRIKVKLGSITWAQVESGSVLQATVDGRGAASVKLLEGWHTV